MAMRDKLAARRGTKRPGLSLVLMKSFDQEFKIRRYGDDWSLRQGAAVRRFRSPAPGYVEAQIVALKSPAKAEFKIEAQEDYALAVDRLKALEAGHQSEEESVEAEGLRAAIEAWDGRRAEL